MMHVLNRRCNGGVYPSWRHHFAVPVCLRAAGQIAGGLGFECWRFCITNLASAGLLSCRVEDFSLSAASEATEEPRHGRFVLPTFFLGDGQANRLPHPDFIFMGAASLGLGSQGDNVIRGLLSRN